MKLPNKTYLVMIISNEIISYYMMQGIAMKTKSIFTNLLYEMLLKKALEWGQSQFPYLKWKGNSNVSNRNLCNLPGILISKLTMFEHLHPITAIIMHIPVAYSSYKSAKWVTVM